MIRKQRLTLETGGSLLELPKSAKILCAGLDVQHIPCIWYTCEDSDVKTAPYIITAVWTGDCSHATAGEHLGSLVHDSYVWHIFGKFAA